MRKNKRLLTYQERSDRNLMWFTIGVAIVVCLVIYVIPSGTDEAWIGHFEQHSSSQYSQTAAHF